MVGAAGVSRGGSHGPGGSGLAVDQISAGAEWKQSLQADRMQFANPNGFNMFNTDEKRAAIA